MRLSRPSALRRRTYLTTSSTSGVGHRRPFSDPTLVMLSSSSSSSLMTAARTFVAPLSLSFFFGSLPDFPLSGQSLDMCPCFLHWKQRPSLESFSLSSFESLSVLRASTSIALGSRSRRGLVGRESYPFIRFRRVLMSPLPPTGPRELRFRADRWTSIRHEAIHSS